MRKRLLVATAVTAVLAVLSGCSGGVGSLSMEPADDARLVNETSTHVPQETDEYDRRSQLLRQALRNGSATTAAADPPVDPDGSRYRLDGRLYTLSVDTAGETTGRRVVHRLDANATAAEANRNGWTVAEYGSLPAVDRATLEQPMLYLRLGEARRSVINESRTYTPAELNRSAIATGRYDAVRRDGELFALDVERSEQRELTVYRYRGTLLTDDTDAYTNCLREEYAFELTRLGQAERDVMTEAIDGTYRADDTDDAAFRSVAERFRDRTAISVGSESGSWLARYDGRLYWADLRYGGFDQYRRTRPPTTAPTAVCP